MENTLSIQNLRENLPAVIKDLQKGESFVLIYRSQPVGHLMPLSETPKNKSALSQILVRPSKSLLFKSSKRAVKLVRDER
ncbi:MAG: hypothetical protein A3G32_10355 [Deltaproteobacteria bacterium RIFCSPLOWO2_12_FULL_40_28]|nr:MAG: hypothetical protein A3C45_05365 [Deltaproteobacteria bacterium RIFCSPHIGHO2_02_FULL_40_28]OGQ20425.1 MAG: hypothetical protein A3E27_00745 [Deltaproteobacteria bacterium RIFCSPHIGHO2_12_FULL_40_32]OGQ41394.1 MAG: hypothetical protein A3I69_02395 [Deltaproteobacteria bacterium RIFCSPLOWO2_02_FULL_40_36]OGQ55033.1 MAG: hypothetical protein A3G32_10355 [Deltaproteobacteria bacterium RIFCSPLOWO2_12_FULL_40_28]